MDITQELERLYADEYNQEAKKKVRHRFVEAGRFWQFMLNTLGFAGITTPWRTIYLLPQYFDHPRLRQHELAHITQIDRDGGLKFILKAGYYIARYGYRNSPYEIEARKAEDSIQLDMFE